MSVGARRLSREYVAARNEWWAATGAWYGAGEPQCGPTFERMRAATKAFRDAMGSATVTLHAV